MNTVKIPTASTAECCRLRSSMIKIEPPHSGYPQFRTNCLGITQGEFRHPYTSKVAFFNFCFKCLQYFFTH